MTYGAVKRNSGKSLNNFDRRLTNCAKSWRARVLIVRAKVLAREAFQLQLLAAQILNRAEALHAMSSERRAKAAQIAPWLVSVD